MKCFVLTICVLLGTASAGPVQRPEDASAFELFKLLEDFVGQEGHELLTKVVQVIHEIEGAIFAVKNVVPLENKEIHKEADDVLDELSKITDEFDQILGGKPKSALYGFNVLDGLSELTGGTQLGTVIRLIRLADAVHRVVDDAKNFAPNLEKELNKIQGKIGKHVSVLAIHVVKELGLKGVISHGMVNKITDLMEKVKEEAHVLLLKVVHEIENTFDLLKSEYPDIYKTLEGPIDEIRQEADEILIDINKSLGGSSYGILDIAGDFTKGTSLGTVIRLMSIVDKFNKVVQDARGFEPKAEILLEHSVKRVADHAQEFYKHAAELLLKSY